MFNGLSNSKKKTYLGIANGRITYKPGRDMETQTFEQVDGIIKGIERRDAEINGSKMKIYDINLVDNQGEQAVLSVIADGGVARGLVMALVNIPDMSKPVRIRAYSQDREGRSYTSTIVYQNGEKVPWIKPMNELPKGEAVMVNGKPFVVNGTAQYDYSARNAEIDGYVDQVNAKCAAVNANEAPEVEFDDEHDMPAEL